MDVLNELDAVWRQDRLEEAEEICRLRLPYPAGRLQVLTNMGLTLMDQGRTDEAKESFRAALRIKPDAFQAMMNLGIAISNGGNFEEAMDPLWDAFELCTDSADAVQNVGMNLGRMGRLVEAIAFYEHAPEVTTGVSRGPSQPRLRVAATRRISNVAGPNSNGDGNASPIPVAGSTAHSGTAINSAIRRSCSTSSKDTATSCNSSAYARWSSDEAESSSSCAHGRCIALLESVMVSMRSSTGSTLSPSATSRHR